MNKNGDNSEEEDMLEEGEEAEASRAVVRTGYWKLLDTIAGKEEELVSIENDQLLGVHAAQQAALQGRSSPGGGDGRIGEQASVQAVL